MALVLYAATAAALLWLAHRFVMPISRASALILFLLPLCFTGRALFTGGVYAPVDLIYVGEPFIGMKQQFQITHVFGSLSDIACQMVPWRAAVRHAFWARELPLWNPYILSGDILAATAQPAVYSPFTWIAVLLPVAVSMTYTAAIQYFIAALGGFLFARELGCRDEAAWFGAAGWAFCTALTIFILWPDGHAFALFPLVLIGTRRTALSPGVRSASILMIAFALMVVSGHPETLLHAVTIAFPYGIFLLIFERRRVFRAIAFATAAGIIALALTAVQLLPLLEAMPQSGEYRYRHDVWAGMLHAALPEESRARLLGDLFPYFIGRHWRDPKITQIPFDSPAAGSLVLALAAFGLWCGRVRERYFLLGIVVFGAAARMALPLFAALVRPIPGLNIAINERFAFAAAFALAMLAALGIEAWIDRGRRTEVSVLLAAFAIVLGAVTLYLLKHDPTDGAQEWRSYPIAGELIPLALAIPIAAMLRPRFAAAALLLLLVIQRFLTVGMIYPTLPARIAYPDVPMFSVMQKTREPFRVVGTGGALIPGTAAVYQLEDVRGYEALTFDRYKMTFPLWCVEQPIWWNRVDDLSKPFLSFLNVRYAITGMREPPPGWHVVAEESGSRILENEHVLPRAFVPPLTTVGREASVDPTLLEMQGTSDFGERAWIDADLPRHEERNGPGVVSSIEKRPNGLRIRVNMARAGRVVVSETAWKGWRAYIDGRRVQMQIADLAFLAIYVPAGPHSIRLVYLPDSFVIGRAITFATLIALILAAALQRLQLLLQRRDRGVAALPLRQ